MKTSELKQLIQSIVAEEVRSQLPALLSEMYVRKIVSEQTSTAQPVHHQAPVQRPAARHGKKSLAETLGYGEEEEPQFLNAQPPAQQQTMSRQQLRERIKHAVLEDPAVNPMAELYEGTSPIVEEDVTSPFGPEGVPIEELGLPDFSRLIETRSSNVASTGPVPETEAMVTRRLERQRALLDARRV